MGVTLTFDTLQYVKTLKAADVPEKQAEAQANALSQVLNTQDVATKQDLRELENSTDSKFELLRKEMDLRFSQIDAKVESIRKDIIIKMGGMFIVAVGIIVSVLLNVR